MGSELRLPDFSVDDGIRISVVVHASLSENLSLMPKGRLESAVFGQVWKSLGPSLKPLLSYIYNIVFDSGFASH